MAKLIKFSSLNSKNFLLHLIFWHILLGTQGSRKTLKKKPDLATCKFKRERASVSRHLTSNFNFIFSYDSPGVSAASQQTLFIVSGSPSNPRGGKPNTMLGS